jgi:hypothetical protein
MGLTPMNDSTPPPSTTNRNARPRRFFRAGGVDQIMLRSGADISGIATLDLKLWFALSMPVTGIEIDPGTLKLVDTDKDGRIRAPEIIAAVRWAEKSFANLDDLYKGSDSVPLAAIRDERIALSARNILATLGKPDAVAVTLADACSMEAAFAKERLNGDGVVTPESALDAATRQAIADIVAATGGAMDRSGAQGVDAATLDSFFSQAQSYLEWNGKAATDATLSPCGAGTADAMAAVLAVKAKVDDYFARARLAAYDPRCADTLNRKMEEFAAVSAKDLSANVAEASGFPLAVLRPDGALPLVDGINPAWAGAVRNLREKTVLPLVGNLALLLTQADWERMETRLAPYAAWQAAKPATGVEKLGAARLQELTASDSKASIAALIAADDAQRDNYDRLSDVEKLVRFQRDLTRLLTNYVNFSEFYQRRTSVFIAGDLYMDSRACHLCIEVADPAGHAALAGLAGMYLAYCDIKRPCGQKKTIVAAFTNGDSDNLMTGRNGVFFDRKGNDWDATITKIISNPISLHEAFWSPYKKLQRFIEEMVARRAAGADAAASDKMTGTAEWAAASNKEKQAAPLPKKIDVGTVAALGVALGAIGAMLSALATGLLSLSWWQFPFVFAGIMLLISTPSMIMAWLKLKRRNIAPILDANGWAINTRARINTPFGAAMTDSAKIPAYVKGTLIDPFAEKKSHWQVYAVAAVLVIGTIWVLDRAGKIYQWTDGIFGTQPMHVEMVVPQAMPEGATPASDVPAAKP